VRRGGEGAGGAGGGAGMTLQLSFHTSLICFSKKILFSKMHFCFKNSPLFFFRLLVFLSELEDFSDACFRAKII
jgi:hypothetical protein